LTDSGAMREVMQTYMRAVEAMNRGQWRQAQQLVEQVEKHAPTHGGVHFIAGVSALQLQQLPLAIEHLEKATRYGPDRADYFAQYARALAISGNQREAVAVADTAIGLASTDATTWDTLGVVYTLANAHQQAADAFRRAVELSPDNANLRFNLATSFMQHGDIDMAEREYEICAEIDPTYWRAYMGLSQLRTQTREQNHIARISKLLQDHLQDVDARLYLNLSLAKEFEGFGEYSTAFDHYTRGKAAHRDRTGYSSERDAAIFDAIRRYFDELKVGTASEEESDEPIFVFGMPRSGTTLTDRILSSHSAVHSAGELDNFGTALQRAAGGVLRSLPDTIARLGSGFSDWARLGNSYLESTRPGTGGTPHFVDKLPHNFLYAGFIAQALPRAKLICLRRDPMDTCLSNFRQLFALESIDHAYSFDLLDTGRYYLRFDRLMRYYQQMMPGRILELHYEQLVHAQENTTRMLLDFCGLPWEEACLSFERNLAPVATASVVQVRSGMNASLLYRWKRYGAQMDGLRRLLEEGGVEVG
jgi:tetratricopeptide (TPR) repeat protein